jgi:hypothetical protein
VLPSALIVAGILAVLSRLGHFDPPYVYGLIAVYIGAERALRDVGDQERRKEEGLRTLIGMLCLFALSVIAWFAWVPVDHHIDGGQRGLGWLVLDSVLATVFLLGLESAVFGLIPLTFLKGKEVYRWRRAIWTAAFVLIAYVFINVSYVVREATPQTLADIVWAGALFIAFGLFSGLFWAYFNPRLRSLVRRFIHLPVR